MDALSRQLFDDANAHRWGAGLLPLRENGYLVAVARMRAQDMADHHYVSHVSPITGEDVYAILDRYGIPYSLAAENLAANTYSGAACVADADRMMMSSPVHRGHILDPRYTDVGIAVATDAMGTSYFAMVFTAP